jgi:hypothetical protein
MNNLSGKEKNDFCVFFGNCCAREECGLRLGLWRQESYFHGERSWFMGLLTPPPLAFCCLGTDNGGGGAV